MTRQPVVVIRTPIIVTGVATPCKSSTDEKARIRWKDMWLGAFLTALLFVIGKSLMGFWQQRSEVGGEWGSAGASIVAMLMWSYYTSLIVMLGAEVTKAWAELYGGRVTAEAGAVRAVEVTKHQPSSPPASS